MGLNGLYIIVVGKINVMIATIGPMFEPDYIDQFRMYMEAKEVLTYALCGIDLRSKNRCDGFLFKTALYAVEKAVREPPISTNWTRRMKVSWRRCISAAG